VSDEAKESSEDYEFTLTSVDKLTKEELAACIDIIAEGEAVSRAAAERGVPNAAKLALVRHRGEIVGVGVIKGPNAQHARTVARKSKHAFADATPELGYASVRKAHRGRHLSSAIFDALLAQPERALYATTSCPKMEHLLDKHGFQKKGESYKGDRDDDIFLWLKE
jgi:hypothetical protein